MCTSSTICYNQNNLNSFNSSKACDLVRLDKQQLGYMQYCSIEFLLHALCRLTSATTEGRGRPGGEVRRRPASRDRRPLTPSTAKLRRVESTRSRGNCFRPHSPSSTRSTGQSTFCRTRSRPARTDDVADDVIARHVTLTSSFILMNCALQWRRSVINPGGPGHLSPSFNPPFFPSLSQQGLMTSSRDT